ncbi:hypothetical protein A2997_02095 [Candidatus Nomurabacteria bacterium RIFCSPLOWO2_01_FULL_36_10b]|uniref:Peptidoglycan binding-like domain-containing protein n=1 Tax=Candidatus Nomurabacteria bacterium RIFCSPLOWO2_01_FULL_36_10b TaxID=1801766 RepID=A0A1F6WPA2_9BACT|nr:MAG: hypothetical protein A2997_02095 [Candidatus Nomurabacteria bacterium RIFCSPLOWO2_01_FULL_36_10b]
MQRFFYTSSWFIVVVGVGVLGYFAYTRLSHDFVYESQNNDAQGALLVYDNNTPIPPIATSDTTTTIDTTGINSTTQTSSVPSDDSSPVNVTNNEKYADLIATFDKLITEYSGVMKKGGKGTRVGTIQEFLNVYDGKDITVNNIYGPATTERVTAFQKAEKLTADGQAGPGTFKAMKAWLEKQ